MFSILANKSDCITLSRTQNELKSVISLSVNNSFPASNVSPMDSDHLCD